MRCGLGKFADQFVVSAKLFVDFAGVDGGCSGDREALLERGFGVPIAAELRLQRAEFDEDPRSEGVLIAVETEDLVARFLGARDGLKRFVGRQGRLPRLIVRSKSR